MGTRRLIWLAALALAVGGTAWLLLSLPESEPVYQGRRLSAWLAEASESTDADAQSQAVHAIRTIGTNALPSLIRMMRVKDSRLKLAMLRLVRKQQLVKFELEQASDLHTRAAYGCSLLQSEARPAIPALMQLLQEEEHNFLVPHALVRIGPDGVLALLGGLTTTNANVRHNIAAALADIGIRRSFTNATPEQIATLDQEANIAVPALMKLLTNRADPARGQAALTLGVLGAQADIVIPALIAALQDATNSENGVPAAISAASALGRFRHEAEAAVPALVVALQSPSAGLQDAAARALKKIDPEAAAEAGVK